MKSTKTLFLTVLTLAVLTMGAWAENPASGAPATKETTSVPASPPPITAADVQSLRDAMAAQQQQIERLTLQLQRLQAGQPPQPTSDKTDAVPASQQLAEVSNVAIQQNPAPSGLNLQETTPQTPPNPMESPVISIRFKGITITPGGFAEAAFVRRSRALGADLTTPFNSLTMPGASQSQLSEFFGSARQSRPTIYVDGRLGNVEFSSYVSGDFLSAADTSTATADEQLQLPASPGVGPGQIR